MSTEKCLELWFTILYTWKYYNTVINYTGIKIKELNENNVYISAQKSNILTQIILLKGTIILHSAIFSNPPESHNESDLVFSP